MMAITLRSPAEHQCQQGADAGRGERGDDRDGVDVAFVEDAEHDVDGTQSGEDQEQFVGERVLEGLGCASEAAVDGGGQAHVMAGLLNVVDRVAERHAWLEVEGDGHRRELALVVDGQRGVGRKHSVPRRRAGPGGRCWSGCKRS